MGKAALTDQRGKIGPDAGVGPGKDHGVEALTALDFIGTVAAVHKVVTVTRVDEVVAVVGKYRVISIRCDDVVIGAVAKDHLVQFIAFDVVNERRAGELLAIEVGNDSVGKANVFQTFLVGDAVLDRHFTGETGIKASHHELGIPERDHLEGAHLNAVALGQFNRVVDRVNANECGTFAVRIVQVIVPRSVEVAVSLLDVPIVEDQVISPDNQRYLERCHKAWIILDDRVIVGRNNLDVDKAFVRLT